MILSFNPIDSEQAGIATHLGKWVKFKIVLLSVFTSRKLNK